MSFSSEVKDELSRHIPSKQHCRIAELAAIISMCGTVSISSDDCYGIRIVTENLSVARKYFTLLKKTFNISTELVVKYNMDNRKSRQYFIYVTDSEDSIRLLKATKLIDNHMEICENMSLVNNSIIERQCCKRAFIRGAFLANGSISDPNKAYHFEIVCQSEEKAEQLKNIIDHFISEAKTVRRKNHYVTYIKEGSLIVDMLNIMEAHQSLMNLENVRIVKEVRNAINRKVNCEAANLNKTISAAVKQIEDIEYIRYSIGLDKLSENLRQIAVVRLENPEATLTEISSLLPEPIGKSGVNHRLKKISEIATELKNRRI